MKKLCDSCKQYLSERQFCMKLYIKVGRNLVDYCKDYEPKNRGQTKAGPMR